ncbi:MAG: hypothetical protein HKN04_06350 [Rhodothermaceae bacterium]|nr:hypothetical protein [Rhodothermaceae bacterium]
MRVAVLLALSLVLAACDSNAPSATYPPPGTHPAVALADLASVAAGTYNVEAYVSSISECPPDINCFVPDHFTAVASLDEDPRPVGVMVFAEQPSQLTVEAFYLFSVDVSGEPGTGRAISLRGYAEAERLE